MPDPTAPLHEVFFSVQGEGLWIGLPQIFVRVEGCDLACRYCDTAAAREIGSEWSLDLPGQPPSVRPNRATASQVAELIGVWLALPGRPAVHSVALTGGEPLLYPEFVAALGQALRPLGVGVYLETGGHHPAELAQVIEWIERVSLDYKLPSTLPEPVAPEVFAKSVHVAARRQFYVKMVVTNEVTDAELAAACAAIAEAEPHAPLVLQPVTGVSPAGGPPSAERLLELLAVAGKHLPDVRVIPQCHQAMGLR